MDEIRTFEHSTLKVPYEGLNKTFRGSQKVIDRELSYVLGATSEATARSKDPNSTSDDVINALDNVILKLTSLKRKADECIDDEKVCVRCLRTRLDHLKSFASGQLSKEATLAWKKKRIDRMIVDHFLRSGLYNTAIAIAKNSEIELMEKCQRLLRSVRTKINYLARYVSQELVDVDLFLVAQKVESSLRSHDTQPCLAWCHENRSKLKKLKSSLEFRVHLQNFIELVRAEKRMDAIKYARKYFSNVEEAHVKEVQVAMALLAFQPGTSCKKYEKLFSESRWTDLIKLFHQENYALHQLNGQSLLSVTLQAGLSSLKTPQCGKMGQCDLQCPVCTEPLSELAKPLPYSHCAQSHLICALSGKVMDDNNPPMALPNGHVYGENALKAMAAENNGTVVCPKTNDTFQFSEAKKVFIL